MTLDEKLIVSHHDAELLEALQDIADAYVVHQAAKPGRQREAALTRLVMEGKRALDLLNRLNLR